MTGAYFSRGFLVGSTLACVASLSGPAPDWAFVFLLAIGGLSEFTWWHIRRLQRLP